MFRLAVFLDSVPIPASLLTSWEEVGQGWQVTSLQGERLGRSRVLLRQVKDSSSREGSQQEALTELVVRHSDLVTGYLNMAGRKLDAVSSQVCGVHSCILLVPLIPPKIGQQLTVVVDRRS